MPGSSDPNDTYPLVPARDKDKSEDQQRRFIFRHLTAREWKQASRILDDLDNAATGADAIDHAIACMSLAIVGWENVTDRDGQPLPFAHKNMDMAGTDKDLIELATRMVLVNGVTPEQQKKFESPSASAAESPAKDAPGETNAKTPQPQPSQSILNAPSATEPVAGANSNAESAGEPANAT